MIRAVFALAVLLAASPCAAADATPAGPAPTCPQPSWYNLDFFPPPSGNQLTAGRSRVVAFAVQSDAQFACLRDSLGLIEAKWISAGQLRNAVVESAIGNTISSVKSARDAAVAQFNEALLAHNAHLHGDEARALAPITPADLAISSGATSPSPSADLNLPSRGIGRSHDCSSFYLLESKRANETGQVTIGYDVGIDGAIINAHIVTSAGFKRLDDAAMTCVTTQWRNMPALQGGAPAASPGHTAIITFNIW